MSVDANRRILRHSIERGHGYDRLYRSAAGWRFTWVSMTVRPTQDLYKIRSAVQCAIMTYWQMIQGDPME